MNQVEIHAETRRPTPPRPVPRPQPPQPHRPPAPRPEPERRDIPAQIPGTHGDDDGPRTPRDR